MNLYDDEMADKLIKEGCGLLTPTSFALTFMELNSLKKLQIMVKWLMSPSHGMGVFGKQIRLGSKS